MKVLVSGSSGMVGANLVAFLASGGHDVHRLVRTDSTNEEDQICWNPAGQTIDRDRLDGFDAVVHLAGENIGNRRWRRKQKKRILDSRVQPTRFLARTLAQLDRPPKTLLCASAIGYYGDRGDETLDENSLPGEGFLPEVCREWEAACEPAREAGIRVAAMRFGVILSPLGGALKKMLLPFKMGVGGVIGSGRQFWSWVGIDDVQGAILHTISEESLRGPVNVVAPNSVTNRTFTKILGRVLKRPTIFPMPAFVIRMILGEMANELLLASARVRPMRLLETGYEFRHSDLESALRHVLGR